MIAYTERQRGISVISARESGLGTDTDPCLARYESGPSRLADVANSGALVPPRLEVIASYLEGSRAP